MILAGSEEILTGLWQVSQVCPWRTYQDFSQFWLILDNISVMYHSRLFSTPLNTYHSWQRVRNPPMLWRPSFTAYPPFSNFVQIPLPNLQPHCLFIAFFLWLNVWSRIDVCVILLNDIMDLHMSSFGTTVLERPCCVFYVSRILIWYHKHTHKYTQHTQGLTDWQTHVNIYQRHLLHAHSSCLYYTE